MRTRVLIVALSLALLAGCGAAGGAPAHEEYRIVPATECPEGDPPNVIKTRPGEPIPATAEENYQRWRDGGSFVACSKGEVPK